MLGRIGSAIGGVFGGGPQGGAQRQNFLQRGLSGIGEGLSNFGERLERTNPETGVSGLQNLGLMMAGLSGDDFARSMALQNISDTRSAFAEDREQREQQEAIEAQRAQIRQLGESMGLEGTALANFMLLPENVRNTMLERRFAPDQPDMPSSIREYEYARSQGYEGTLADYQRDKAERTTINTAPAPFDPSRALTEATIDDYAVILDQGVAATRNLGRIDRLSELLEGAETGPSAQFALLGRRLGLELGENVSNLEAAEAIISQLVPEQRPPGSGVISDADLALYKNSLPQLVNTSEGNRLILETMRGINEHDRQAADIVRRVRRGEISLDEADQLMAQLTNPIDAVRSYVTARQAPSGSYDLR